MLTLALLQEVGAVLGLMANIATAQPAIVPDLMSINVEAAGSGAAGADAVKQTWLDVATMATALMTDLAGLLAGQPQGDSTAWSAVTSITGSALQLMQAISVYHPEAVCTSLQATPLFAASGSNMGLPPSLAMTSLPSVPAQNGAALC